MGLWFSPAKVARHETYHLVGCEHDMVMDACYRHIAEAKWIENRLQVAGCYEKLGVDPFFPAFSHAGMGPILLTRSQGNGILGLEKDLSFNSFMDCARYAGLPVDQKGVLEVADAESWMNKAIEDTHHVATQSVVVIASPVAGTSDHPSASPAEAAVTAVSRPLAPALSNKKPASLPTPTILRANTAMVDSLTVALYAAYPGLTSAPQSAEYLLPSI